MAGLDDFCFMDEDCLSPSNSSGAAFDMMVDSIPFLDIDQQDMTDSMDVFKDDLLEEVEPTLLPPVASWVPSSPAFLSLDDPARTVSPEPSLRLPATLPSPPLSPAVSCNADDASLADRDQCLQKLEDLMRKTDQTRFYIRQTLQDSQGSFPASEAFFLQPRCLEIEAHRSSVYRWVHDEQQQPSI